MKPIITAIALLLASLTAFAEEAITSEAFIAEALNLRLWTLPGQMPDSAKEIVIRTNLEKLDGTLIQTLGGLTVDRASLTGTGFTLHMGAWLRDDLKTVKMTYRLGRYGGGSSTPLRPEHFASVLRQDEPDRILGPSQILLTFPNANERLVLTVEYKK